MKPAFDEETVRYLGYQKYYPEKTDFIKGIFVVLFGFLLIVGVVLLIKFAVS